MYAEFFGQPARQGRAPGKPAAAGRKRIGNMSPGKPGGTRDLTRLCLRLLARALMVGVDPGRNLFLGQQRLLPLPLNEPAFFGQPA